MMMGIRLAWDRPTRPPDQLTEHVLLIGLTPQAGTTTLPANVCIVLDCSGSMKGVKLEEARNACCSALQCLHPNDILSVVTYSSRAKQRIAPVFRRELADADLETHLRAIRAEGLTRTDLALQEAESVLRTNLSPERFSAIVLITDGHPTDGNGQNLDKEHYTEFYQTAQRLAASGIALLTVGLGSARHYNSRFLTELADRGQGEFCYAPEPARLAEVLDARIHAAQSAVLTGLELRLAPRIAGVRLTGFCRIAPHYRSTELAEPALDGTWHFPCGSLEVQTNSLETCYLARVELEGMFGMDSGSHPVLGVTASWTAPLAGRLEAPEAVADLRYTPIAAEQCEVDREVREMARRWEVILCQEEASRTASPSRAAEMLSTVVKGAAELGLQEIAVQSQQQIDEIRRTGRSDPDAMTHTAQILRQTGHISRRENVAEFGDLGLGFGGGDGAPNPGPSANWQDPPTLPGAGQ